MKTRMKQLTAGAFLAFLLLAGNVKADGTEINASGHERIETKLQLETWMTDEAIWDINFDYAADFAPEAETTLELEKWMTNDVIWNTIWMENVETEKALKIEPWMISETIWSGVETTVEKELALESWMTDSEIWK